MSDCANISNARVSVVACTYLLDSTHLSVDQRQSVLANRGAALVRTGDFKQALADLDRALELGPADARTLFNRGNAFQALGDLNSALRDYDEAIRLDPDYVSPYVNRGIIQSDRGRLAEALADLDKAVTLMPNHAGSVYNRGVVHLKRGSLELAIADFKNSLRIDPLYYHPRLMLFRLDCRRGRIDRAPKELMAQLRQSEQFTRDMQIGLSRGGYYTGRIDGDFGPASQAAIDAFVRDGCP